jgi:hypothetical protein
MWEGARLVVGILGVSMWGAMVIIPPNPYDSAAKIAYDTELLHWGTLLIMWAHMMARCGFRWCAMALALAGGATTSYTLVYYELNLIRHGCDGPWMDGFINSTHESQ